MTPMTWTFRLEMAVKGWLAGYDILSAYFVVEETSKNFRLQKDHMSHL